jgi:hypothetical protein
MKRYSRGHSWITYLLATAYFESAILCAHGKEASVCSVEFNDVHESEELSQRAREAANEFYPKILALLQVKPSEAPEKFTVMFQKRASVKTLMNETSEGYTAGTKIHLSVGQFTNNPAALTPYLIHEMTHVAQSYRWAKVPPFWVEGIADYASFKLCPTNYWMCAQCSAQFPHYTSGYSCTAAFLGFLSDRYGPSLVPKLHQALRHRSYSDGFFKHATGRTLEQLWAEFQQTPAFTRSAAELLKVEETLGYVNGQPPKHASDIILKKAERLRITAMLKEHPGGALVADALKFLTQQKDAGEIPGWGKHETGSCLLSHLTLPTT